MSRVFTIGILLTAVVILGSTSCSGSSDDGMGYASVATSVLGGQTEGPQEQETEPKEKKKSLLEKLKEGASKVLKKGEELAEAGEILLGAEMKPYVVAQTGGVYPDRELQAFLETIVLGMAKKTAKPDIPWDFTILNSSELNACSLPGGKLFITRGLLAALHSEAQFAHLMGHEMGHVVERHMIEKWGLSVARVAALRAAAIAEQKVLEKDPADALFVTAALGVGVQFVSLEFSRAQEEESDERGVDYAVGAGYDPREGKKTFEMFLRMKEAAGQDETLVGGLLASHPFDSDRIERIDAYIQETYPEVVKGERSLVVSSDAWQEHRDRLRGVLPAYDKHRRAMALVAKAVEEGTQEGMEEALDLLDQGVADLPDDPALHFSRGYLKYIMGRDAEAEKDLDRAISLDGGHFQARLLRGLIRMNAKRYEEAVEDLEAAVRLFLTNAAPHFYLGECYEALGRETAAMVSFGTAVVLAPKGSKLRELAAKRLAALRDGE